MECNVLSTHISIKPVGLNNANQISFVEITQHFISCIPKIEDVVLNIYVNYTHYFCAVLSTQDLVLWKRCGQEDRSELDREGRKVWCGELYSNCSLKSLHCGWVKENTIASIFLFSPIFEKGLSFKHIFNNITSICNSYQRYGQGNGVAERFMSYFLYTTG